jgi:low density lipoprotein-related protein 2
MPSSLALDSARGVVVWSDAGSIPKIESSWMDGSKRYTLVSENLRYPTGLSIDYNNNNRIYFVDTKLNKIESISWKGSDRITILQEGSLRHPIALDVFESSIYYINRDSGDLTKHDKFGRGVSVSIERDLVNPTSVKVFHQLRYNSSIVNPCKKNQCSHLCLLIPNGYRCACPENTIFRIGSNTTCDAAFEQEKPSPQSCHCENGGVCKVGVDGLECICQEDFSGQTCNQHVQRRRLEPESISTAAYIIPIVLILLLSLAGLAFFIFLKKKNFNFAGKAVGLSPAVSFRQGSNVTFNDAAMAQQSPPDTKIDLKSQRDFSNPMFEAGGPDDGSTSTPSQSNIAVLPTTILQRSSPQIQIRQFDPNAEDSGKDTQTLVNEADC